MTAKILTANRLRDGLVVYLTAQNAWTEFLPEAMVARDDDEETKLLHIGANAVADRQVVDPYLIIVNDDGGRVRPALLREAIRAGGPTVETLRDAPASEN